jgi:hypothetical protein
MTLSRGSATLLLVVCVLSTSCRTFQKERPAPPPPPPSPGQPLPPAPVGTPDDEPALVVKKVQEEIIVAAWAEPAKLPEGGGQSQILVRVQKRGGARFRDVEVRLRTSNGSLYSSGRILVTDHQGMTRDRLTTKSTATITLNAGGTRYRFQIPVGEQAAEKR